MANLSDHFCPNPKCPDYQIRKIGNITTSTRYGKNKTQLLRCRSCNYRFSENHDTIFMHSNYSKQQIQRIVLAIAENNSIRGTARILSFDKDAVNRIVLKVDEHCKKILGDLIRDLYLNECQIDVLWSFVKKRNLFPMKTSEKYTYDIGPKHRSTRDRS